MKEGGLQRVNLRKVLQWLVFKCFEWLVLVRFKLRFKTYALTSVNSKVLRNQKDRGSAVFKQGFIFWKMAKTT